MSSKQKTFSFHFCDHLFPKSCSNPNCRKWGYHFFDFSVFPEQRENLFAWSHLFANFTFWMPLVIVLVTERHHINDVSAKHFEFVIFSPFALMAVSRTNNGHLSHIYLTDCFSPNTSTGSTRKAEHVADLNYQGSTSRKRAFSMVAASLSKSFLQR